MHITTTTPASLHRFLRFHYRGGPPGPVVRVLAAKDGDHTMGVLAISMPTLNAPGRAALPLPIGSATERARWLNANLRTISRIIVDPRDRGRGVGAALIRAYLADALTPHTEAFAAMGHLCPLFVAAGMIPIEAPPQPRDQRLMRALIERRIGPEHLIDSRFAQAIARSTPAVAEALRRWANDSRATRPLMKNPADLPIIAARAAQHLLFPPKVYHASTP